MSESGRAFAAFGESRPDLYRHVATLLSRRLRATDDALVATNFLSVKGRVARALLSLAEAFGRDRSRRDGRHCPGKCQPRPQRLGKPFASDPSGGLLLPGEQGGPPTRRRGIAGFCRVTCSQRQHRGDQGSAGSLRRCECNQAGNRPREGRPNGPNVRQVTSRDTPPL